jgi:hypothetical protein
MCRQVKSVNVMSHMSTYLQYVHDLVRSHRIYHDLERVDVRLHILSSLRLTQHDRHIA